MFSDRKLKDKNVLINFGKDFFGIAAYFRVSKAYQKNLVLC